MTQVLYIDEYTGIRKYSADGKLATEYEVFASSDVEELLIDKDKNIYLLIDNKLLGKYSL